MKKFAGLLIASAILLPVNAHAAEIFDIQTTKGSLVYDNTPEVAKAAVNNGVYENSGGSNKAYLFNEGTIGNLSSFLLLLDADRTRITNTGSFKIQLASWERLAGISRTAPQLRVTDPNNSWTYGGSSRGLEGADRFSVAELDDVLTVNYSLTAVGAYDDVRIQIAAIPEPATWAMFFMGFGLVGWSMRRRAQESRCVSFA